jgi:glucose uptake protein
MILPSSYNAILVLLVLGMLAWGAWANTFKAAGGEWRFELYSFDFAIGVLVAAVVCALTWGNLGFDGFSFMDDLRLAGKRQELFAFLAGAVFNLGNMLLLGAFSLAGMAVAFPVAIGFAMIVGVCWNFAFNTGGNALVSFAGAAAVFAGIVAVILAYRIYATDRQRDVAEPVKANKAKAKKNKGSSKAIGLGLAGGLLLGSFSLLVQAAGTGENGLGPYSTGFMFAVGVFFSTFVYSLFFMNLPVQGEPIDVAEYARAEMRQHGMGILGGVLWYIGAVAIFIGTRSEGTAARVQPSIVYMLSQGNVIIAAICGLLFWKEFAGADAKVKTYLGLMLILMAIGIGIVSNA